MTALITLSNLAVQFHGAAAPTVHGLSLTIEKGKTTAIVGESGSGKSIAALSILRLNPATYCPEGTVTFDGQSLTDMSETQLQKVRGNGISMIFQEPMTALNPLHSIGRQLREALMLHQPTLTKAEIDDRIETLLEEVGLSYLKARQKNYPHQLSGGERQRVMIAMAIANRPALLIADEPTTALDVSTQATIITLLQNLQNKYDMSLLIISHDLHLVRRIAHHVVVMQHGEAVEQGETESLFANPQHPYTRALLAATHALTPNPPPLSDAPVVLEAENLGVSYATTQGFSLRRPPRKTVIHPLSLSVRAGETLGIVGESGSGKTTLGLALARLLPSEGRIVFQGNAINSATTKALRPTRARLQFVFQDPFSSLNPRFSIGQIIAEGLTLHHPELDKAAIAEQVKTILIQVGLEPDMAGRYPHEFSGGQRQRINIARAMILKPTCVIFDEPTSALDITLQTQILDFAKTFQRERAISYLFISHDIYAVRNISHRIMVLKEGHVVESGAAAELLGASLPPVHQVADAGIGAASMNDTIIALATPMGKSGVAVLRLSGDRAMGVLRTMGVTRPLSPRKAALTPLTHPDTNNIIDSVLVIYFSAPHSFTGEDVVEIHCHGSRAVIQEILSVALSQAGVRHALAGEFSRRALENGKMDLVQVEALMDLIESETAAQKSLALRQLGGEVSSAYTVLRERIIEARAFCEVFIDFPDDDLPDDMDAQINEKVEACAAHIRQLLTTAKAGRQRRDGVQVAIVGIPNAGKSTLINAIAGRQVAITSPIEGTTRDAIELHQDLGGLPYRFFDTAGLRETQDAIEQQGVAIAKRHAEEADVVLLVLDPTQPLPPQRALLDKNVSRETFCVVNKDDTISDASFRDSVRQNVSRETFFVSAKTGVGVAELLEALSARHRATSTEAIFVTRERHVAHLAECLSHLECTLSESDLVLKSEHLIQACHEVGYILGNIHIEDILDTLFASFCIGK